VYFPGAQIMEFTDLEAKSALQNENEYRMSDGGGLYLVGSCGPQPLGKLPLSADNAFGSFGTC
jgi:hypothetical protein